MKKYLIGAKGNFYKANLHVHTNISDGKLSPLEIKKEYMREGYSILAYTDHEVLVPHEDLTDENFLAITAYEASVNEERRGRDFQFMKTYHLNFYARNASETVSPCFNEDCIWLEHSRAFVSREQTKISYPIAYTTECVNDMIKRAKEAGFLVSFNHPVWSLQSYEDYIYLQGLWGVEVYNTAATLEGYPDTDTPFVDLLRAGEFVFPLATDDAHSLSHAFGGFTVVEAERLDYESVFNALEKGDFYASNGPRIREMFLEDGKLTIRHDEAKRVTLRTERRIAFTVTGEHLTETVFDLSWYQKWNETCKDRTPSFIRITLEDERGRKAWTRAYLETELKN